MTQTRRITLTTLTLLGLAACITGTVSLDDADATIEGVDKALYGYAMAAAHADNDLEPDFAIGAPLADQVYIYTDLGAESADGAVSSADAWVFTGEEGGEAGWSLASDELDGNSVFSELIIGAPVEEGGRGRIYVLQGGAVTGDIEASAWVTLVGEDANEWAGFSVATGDVNGDGDDDLIVGAAASSQGEGKVYVVYGPLAPGKAELRLSDADVIIEGDQSRAFFGAALATADLDDDGQDDIIVG